ncbi:MAG TPA: hypothetical protein VNV14_03040 [Opitutaceae bacterium]|jgi:hypothetical protein|nr:hypothetical protein [Opitutaceae bacterium]
MNNRTFSLGRFLLLLLTLHSAALAAVWEINVNTAMTPEGEKIQHPTPDQPAYYFPYCVGYEEIGTVAAGTKKLSTDVPMATYLAEALAAQGYLVTHAVGTKLDPPPSLLLVFRWGYVNPRISDEDAGDGSTPINHHRNERAHVNEMYMLGIQERDLFDDRMVKRDLVASADDNRYFVTIAAYDFATYYTKHKAVLLWVSRMSIPRQDLELDQVVAPLIKTGTPFLGRETTSPQVVDITAPPGNVTIGSTVVKGVVAPAAAQPPAPAKP